MAEKKEIPEDIQAILNKKEGITDAELTKVLVYFGQQAPAGEIDQNISSGDLTAQMTELFAQLDPERLARLQQEAKDKKLAQGINSGVNVLLGLRDAIESGKQIRMSERELKRLRNQTPTRPERMRPSNELRRALSEAQGDRISDAPMAIAREQLREGFANDVATARSASGGQAGAFGALTQLAANRRRRGINELIPQMAQLRQQQTGRIDNLLGRQMQERGMIAGLDQRQFAMDQRQHNIESDAAARLGSMGRSNLRNSLYNMADYLPQSYGGFKGVFNNPFGSRQTSGPVDNTYLGDDWVDQYNNQINANLRGNYTGNFS